MLVDTGAEYLHPCLPEDARPLEVAIRGEYYHLGPRVAYFALRLALRRRRLGLGLRGLYVAAVARAVEARVAVTLIDNNNWDVGLVEAGRCRVVCVQNGWRHPAHVGAKHFDIYCAINALPVDPALDFAITVRDFHAVGHLKMGLYRALREREPAPPPAVPAPVLWISQYRVFRYNNPDADPAAVSIKRMEALGAAHAARFAREQGRPMLVAPAWAKKRVGREEEDRFFADASEGHAHLPEYGDNAWGAYDLVAAADLVVGVYSTLLFEALSVGRKALLFLPAEMTEGCNYVAAGLVLERVERIAVTTPDYESFADKAAMILAMNDDEYLAWIAPFKASVAPFDFDDYPQQRIRRIVADQLHGSSRRS